MKGINLTRISAVTALITLAVQGAVIFGWDITSDQQAWLTGAVVAAGAAVHSLFNPNIPIGITKPEE
jgi:hypothetical protein